MSLSKFYQFVTERATETQPSWTYKDCVRFHYFNPNGLYVQKKAMDARIDALVDAGKAKTGAIIAYGILNHYYTDSLMNLLHKKRVKRIDYEITIYGLKRNLESAQRFITETEGAK